jgi:hypothetical protein
VKHRVLIAILLAFVAGVVIGVRLVQGHPPAPASTPTAFQPFPTYDAIPPSPTPIAGLHDYASPLRSAPTATPIPTERPRPRATAAPRPTKHNDTLGGYATWFATGPDGLYAAAGPSLRQAIGSHWRGSHVLVCGVSGTRCVEVVLNDWCACSPRHGYATVLDLSDEAFRYLAPLSRGVIRVAVDIP